MNAIQGLWAHLVRFGFYLLYNPLAPIYDGISWLVSLGQWREWQLAALPHLQGNDVLELAHGPGHMLLALSRASFRATGIDLSPQMGRLTRRRLAAARMAVPLLRAPAQNLPFAARSFDSVLATFPTEFIVEASTLSEVFRVLRDNGRLVIVPEAHLTGTTAAITLLEFLYRITGQRNEPGGGPPTSALTDRWKAMRDRFESAGYDIHIEHIYLASSEVTVLIATKATRHDASGQTVAS